MPPIYKLVVVDPFENYKRGDQILDQALIANILDEKSDVHHYEKHVRKVLMSEIDKQGFVAPVPANEPAPQAQSPEPQPQIVETPAPLNIESINASENEADSA